MSSIHFQVTGPNTPPARTFLHHWAAGTGHWALGTGRNSRISILEQETTNHKSPTDNGNDTSNHESPTGNGNGNDTSILEPISHRQRQLHLDPENRTFLIVHNIPHRSVSPKPDATLYPMPGDPIPGESIQESPYQETPYRRVHTRRLHTGESIQESPCQESPYRSLHARRLHTGDSMPGESMPGDSIQDSPCQESINGLLGIPAQLYEATTSAALLRFRGLVESDVLGLCGG
ncbi:hypothetical protein E6O75_ATG04569 [Venturia nashicola]|uniref:Uncharacterized protein n=1 Tax=Venturia nashicola TaxID=86259 RepID=A0A4Z1PRT4_9PEZI|nr:hypothetical protein E6O75_ATG04569 [Venturia nashicola]